MFHVAVCQTWLTGAAFAEISLVLAPAQVFTHVHAKSSDRCGIWRRSFGACARSMLHVGVPAPTQCFTQVNSKFSDAEFAETSVVPTPSYAKAFSGRCTPNSLTGAAFGDGTCAYACLHAVSRRWPGVRLIPWQVQVRQPCFRQVYAKCSICWYLLNTLFHIGVHHFKAADVWGICRHLVGTHANTVLHVGVRTIRWQTPRCYLREHDLSRRRAQNLLTGAPLVPAPALRIT